jgi:hypothetical protein
MHLLESLFRRRRKAKSLMLALSHLNERAYGIICLYFRVIKPRDEINAREG